MATYRLYMRDGTVKEFIDRGRPGGSYAQSLRYETGFVVITDCYGGETSIPTGDIREITKEATQGAW